MGLNYRKSLKLGPIRVTASKSGISYSAGVKGARVTKRADGRVQTTLSAPGTGLRYTKTVGASTKKKPPEGRAPVTPQAAPPVQQPPPQRRPADTRQKQRSSIPPPRPPAPGTAPLTVKGYLATVTIYPDRIEIQRKFMGRTNGNRSISIPWQQAVAIDFMDPGRMMNGHIHFVAVGDPRGLTATGGGNRMSAAARNPRAIMFTWQQREDYGKLQELLTRAASSARLSPPPPGSAREPSPRRSADEGLAVRPAWMVNGAGAVLIEGHEDLEVVGESHYQDNLWRLVGRGYDPAEHVREEVTAVLVTEPDNPHDSNAISIWIDGLKVGYLSREDAQRHHAGLLALQDKHRMPVALSGVIAGGGLRNDGPGRLGVFLRYAPKEFGLRHVFPPAQSGSMRSGMSDALATDESDETYDLAWMRDLPADDIRAIPALRRLLTLEQDPLSRHFMHAQLEKMLYRSRNAFSSALDEYDGVCDSHDAEMDVIRAACMNKWSHVPVLETYPQMAIRQQKAKNFAGALWWAERGLAIYGDDCCRQEAVEDLRQRVTKYRAKVATRLPHGEMEDSSNLSYKGDIGEYRRPGRHAKPED